MAAQQPYPPHQQQQRAVLPQGKKIIHIRDLETRQEIQVGNRIKAHSGPPQAAINPASPLGKPAPSSAVMGNPGGNENVLPPASCPSTILARAAITRSCVSQFSDT